MIKSKKSKGMIEIDLTGPDGNVFFLIGQVRKLSELLNTRRGANYLDPKAIINDMMSADYEHAVQVFEKHFGTIVILYR
jgi:hypothetical protein